MDNDDHPESESDTSARFRIQREGSDKTDEERTLGTDDDADTYYETDEYRSEEGGTERMQLNPSTDFYDEYAEDDDDDDDGFYDEGNDKNVDANAESLPEAKSLVQPVDEEEEDMGYDEDDERIAIAVERPKDFRPPHADADDKDFMNEEGSGSYGRTALNRYKNNVNDNRFRLDYLQKYRKKQQKLLTESANTDEVDLRESSGNFANDDEDDDNDDEDDDDSESDEAGDGFFSSKHKSGNRYFRKNTNDAIKIISTPLGKVGIVYQQTPTQGDDKKSENSDKKSTSFTDFDALSPDPESSHRLASSHPKITPVLTPDGKVALLYRGDSENSKYEPIRNLTHKFNNKNDATDNKDSATNNKDTKLDSFDNDRSEDDDSTDSEDEEDRDTHSNNSDMNDNTNAKSNNVESGSDPHHFPAVAPTESTFIVRPTDSVLPMINRPLSEVLGIKKNQFKQFRIKDTPTTTTTEANPRSLVGGVAFDHSDTTTLHFLTKVNLADYPTSVRTRNFDFDFSRDNTMLDERTRHKEQQHQKSQNGDETGEINENKANTIANEEVLSRTEVVNLAIIPHFDEELERLQRENRRHHRQRHRHKQTEEDLSGVHCIMQAMMGIAAISTVFGMLGTFFKQRILDQIRLMHW